MLEKFMTHPKFLDGLNYEYKVETIEGKGVETCSLAHNTLGVEGCARAPRWD